MSSIKLCSQSSPPGQSRNQAQQSDVAAIRPQDENRYNSDPQLKSLLDFGLWLDKVAEPQEMYLGESHWDRLADLIAALGEPHMLFHKAVFSPGKTLGPHADQRRGRGKARNS